MKKLVLFTPLIACLSMSTAIAGDFDGTKLLICAPTEAMNCVSGEPCTSGRPIDFGVPAFLHIDVAKKTIGGPKRTTKIQIVEKSENQILLLGTELNIAWTLALNTTEGTIAGTLADRDGAVALFGACTPQ